MLSPFFNFEEKLGEQDQGTKSKEQACLPVGRDVHKAHRFG